MLGVSVHKRIFWNSLCLFVVASGNAAPKTPTSNAIDFNSQIRPIISAKCFACHGPDEKARKAKLRLDIREEATREREGKIVVIRPGNLQGSELVKRITNPDPAEVMPPPKEGHPLTASEI